MKRLFFISQFEKYYYKQIFIYFIGSTSIFVLLFILGQVRIILETISLENISFLYILRLLILTVPMHLFISMPVGVNLANALLFGFLSANSEILALRSFGAKVEVFLKPVIIFALIVCVLVYLDMDYLYPYTNKIYLNLLVKGQIKTLQSVIQEGKVMQYKNYKIFVASSEIINGNKIFYDVVITEKHGKSYNSVYAKKAFIEENSSDINLISLTLVDGDYILNYQDKKNLIARYERLYLLFTKQIVGSVGENFLMYTIKKLYSIIKETKMANEDKSVYRFIEEKFHFKIGLLIACILFAFAGFSIVKAFSNLSLGLSIFTSIFTIMTFYFIFIGLTKTLVARTTIPIVLIYYPLLGVIALISIILYLSGIKNN
ncbi:MAG: LptF/LptG family permease [Exilispira sp.]